MPLVTALSMIETAIEVSGEHLPASVVKTILDAMSDGLSRGHRIEIRGFGSFSINRRPPRVGRNPRSGEQVVIPEKLVPHFKPGKALREATDEHRKLLWRYVESQIKGPWFLGKTMSALDIYMWPMGHWRPGIDWFAKECPKLHKIARAMKAHPVVKKVAGRNKL